LHSRLQSLNKLKNSVWAKYMAAHTVKNLCGPRPTRPTRFRRLWIWSVFDVIWPMVIGDTRGHTRYNYNFLPTYAVFAVAELLVHWTILSLKRWSRVKQYSNCNAMTYRCGVLWSARHTVLFRRQT